jgi:hypothetical protein
MCSPARHSGARKQFIKSRVAKHVALKMQPLDTFESVFLASAFGSQGYNAPRLPSRATIRRTLLDEYAK